MRLAHQAAAHCSVGVMAAVSLQGSFDLDAACIEAPWSGFKLKQTQQHLLPIPRHCLCYEQPLLAMSCVWCTAVWQYVACGCVAVHMHCTGEHVCCKASVLCTSSGVIPHRLGRVCCCAH